MNAAFNEFRRLITSPFKFTLFTLTKLPSAFFAGLQVAFFNETKTVIVVRQKWFNKNPFHSIYFAVLVMAAEVSTGIAGFAAVYKRSPSVSMLVIKNEGQFYKKATGKISFTCLDVQAVQDLVEQAIAANDSRSIRCHSTGTNEQGELVAEFWFTWSFKPRSV